jgi:UDP-N-acetylglucosamine:LPS N-acetylglucosamine transferase
MRIFVAALDWGLGHTTRIMPLIHQLNMQNHKLVIGCSLVQGKIFQEQFPEAIYVPMVSYSPVFSRKSSQIISIFRFIPSFLYSIYKEKRQLQKLNKQYQFDIILSDNRYGLHLSKCRNIIITHQLRLKLPLKIYAFNKLINRIIYHWINKFEQCLVPDYDNDIRLSGELSAKYSGSLTNLKYIGVLSRFQFISERKSHVPDLLILISGPEKQRTLFEQIAEKQLAEISKKYSYILIRGKPESDIVEKKGFMNHINSNELKYMIKRTKYIICRSGYSTIMDLVCMGKSAMLVPTPGQSEQEYLAKHLSEQQFFIMEKQNKLNLQNAIVRLDNFIPRSFKQAQKSSESFSI